MKDNCRIEEYKGYLFRFLFIIEKFLGFDLIENEMNKYIVNQIDSVLNVYF